MRNYSTIDQVTLGPYLTLSEGDNIATSFGAAASNNNCRSTIAQDHYPSSVEVLLYSPNKSKPALGVNGIALFGILYQIPGQAIVNTNNMGDPSASWFSIAYDPYSGQVIRNGVSIASFVTSTYDDWMRMDLDPVAGTLTFVKNGDPIGTISNLERVAWQYGGSLLANATDDMALYFNPGITPMRYPAPNNAGWWEPALTIEQVLFGSEFFIGKATEDWVPHYTPPIYDEKYDGVINSDITLYDSLHFTPWGSSAPAELGSGGLLQVGIDDSKQKYDALLSDPARGAVVPIMRAQSNDSIDNAESLFVGVLDHCEQTTLYTKSLYARDMRSRLSVALRRALYAPNLDLGVASKPRSMSLGPCRTYTPDLMDTVSKSYGAHDAPITGIGKLRVSGVPLAFGAGSAVLTPDSSGFILTAQPNGQFTAETTSEGAAFDPLATDYLGDKGDFGSCGFNGSTRTPDYWNSNHPEWDDPVDSTGHVVATGIATQRFFIRSSPSQALKCISAGYGYPLTKAMTFASATIKAGRTYAYSIEVMVIPQWGALSNPNGDYVPPAELYIGSEEPAFLAQVVSNSYTSFQLTEAKTYTGFFTSRFSIDKPLCLILKCNDLQFTPANALSFNYLLLGKVYINEQSAIAQNMTLDGPNLDGMLHGLMIDRGPVEESEYVAPDVNTETGYKYGLRVRSSESPTVEQCVQQVLDSSLCDVYNDDDGKFRVIRLSAPELATPVGTLTMSHMLSELRQYPDLAENLTTRASGCRNWDPIGLNDMATADPTYVNIPAFTRAQLSADFQWTATAGIELAQRYRHAYNAEALKTLLDDLADGQDLIKYINTLYKSARNFYVGAFHWPFGKQFKLGQVWRLIYPMFGLETGKQLMIVGRQRQPTQEQCNLIWWGL